MGIALVVIKKEIDGKPYSNTYGVWGGDQAFTTMGDPQMVAIGAGEPFTDDNTNPAHGSYSAGIDILHAIIGFERAFMPSFVHFVNIYVTDGKLKTATPDPQNAYISKALDFNGLWIAYPRDEFAPGNVVLQVNRVPVGFSNRQGRILYRATLLDTEVRVAGARLVDFTNQGVRDAVSTRIALAVANSQLDQWFDGGVGTVSGGPAGLGIPHYVPATPAKLPAEGNLIGLTPISGLTVQGVFGRQVKRGKKKDVTP